MYKKPLSTLLFSFGVQLSRFGAGLWAIALGGSSTIAQTWTKQNKACPGTDKLLVVLDAYTIICQSSTSNLFREITNDLTLIRRHADSDKISSVFVVAHEDGRRAFFVRDSQEDIKTFFWTKNRTFDKWGDSGRPDVALVNKYHKEISALMDALEKFPLPNLDKQF